MTLRIDPRMIILARESRGFTQTELSGRLGIRQGHISKIENGLVGASLDIVDGLVRVLKYPETFFYEAFRIYAPGVPFYRKHKSLSQKDLSAIIATSNIRKNHVEKLLHSVETIDNKIPECNLDEYGSPEEIAMSVRQYWRLPRGPIQDTTKMLEDAGIIVIYCYFDTRFFSGLSLPTDEANYIIFINGNMPGDRIRFTLAHELGHIIMHQLPTPKMEEEADRFASELLMPSVEIRSQLYKVSLDRMATLKRYWKVSMAAILKHARMLGRITEHKYRALWTEMGKSGYRLQEPDELDIPQEKPLLLYEFIDLHLNTLGYSTTELSTLLCLFIDEFLALYAKPQNLLKVL